MKVLVIIEHHHGQVRAASLAAITAARQIGGDVTALVAGYQCQAVVDEVVRIEGVSQVSVVDQPNYQDLLAESLTPLVLHVAQEMTHLIAPATTFGKNLMPRVAAKLNVGQISDIIAVVDENTFKRPIYAGNAIATVRSRDPIRVITVRPTAFAPASSGSQSVPINKIDFSFENNNSQFLSQKLPEKNRPELATASIVLAGGERVTIGRKFYALNEDS